MRNARFVSMCAAVLTALVLVFPAAAADLEGVSLQPEDLPSGFRTVSTSELTDAGVSLEEMGHDLADQVPGADLVGSSVLTTETGNDLIGNFVVGPLGPRFVTSFDRLVSNEKRAMETFGRTPSEYGFDFTEPAPLDPSGLGDTAFGYRTVGTAITDMAYLQNLVTGERARRGVMEVVLARRAQYLLMVQVSHLGDGEPRVGGLEAAELLDAKVRRELGLGGYRPTGTLVPEITTYIPTPADVSTDPGVIGTNLVLAAIATIAFTVALRLLNTSLAEHEGELQRVLPPARWVASGQERIDRAMQARTGRKADVVRIGGILLFYGVVFSLLEPGWNPFTITGLALLVYMTISFGVVGIVDDLAAWFEARRWGLPAKLAIKPALMMLAVASTATTRLFGVVPGIMIGTPDAFPVDKQSLEPGQERRLIRVGAVALVMTGGGAWALSWIAELVRRAGVLETFIAGLEAFLLVVFAVTVQNLFMQMIALRGSIGGALLERSRWLWLGIFTATTFLFLHTLLNPEGAVASALGSANVIVFLVTVGLFVTISVVIWASFRRMDRRLSAVEPTPPETVETLEAAAAEPAQRVASSTPPVPSTVAATILSMPAAAPAAMVPPPPSVSIPPARADLDPSWPMATVATYAVPMQKAVSTSGTVLRPRGTGMARRPCAIGAVRMTPGVGSLVVEGELVDRRTWIRYYVRTLLLLMVSAGLAIGSIAFGAGPAQGDDALIAFALGGVGLGVVLFVWSTVRAIQGPRRLAEPGRIEVPYGAIGSVDVGYDWTWFLLGGFVWIWFVGRKAVRIRAHWYQEDGRELLGTFAAHTPREASTFCATVRTARAYWVARGSMSDSPPTRVPAGVR